MNSFTLVTPNWTVRLPGFPYVGADPDGFMGRSEIVSHFEQYAATFAAPVQYGQCVTAVDPAPDGYRVSTANGGVYTASNVIVATGSYQFPKPTILSQAMPSQIVQLHSSQYRRPDALPPGAVLVVARNSADPVVSCQSAAERGAICASGSDSL